MATDAIHTTGSQARAFRAADPVRILVVEDSADDLLFLERAFRRVGVPMFYRSIGDGVDAMEFLRGDGRYADRAEHPAPTHLILDLKIPRLSGLELLRWIRREGGPRDLKVVLLSSSDEPRDLEAAAELGVDRYFRKPSRLRDLAETVTEIARLWGLSLSLS